MTIGDGAIVETTYFLEKTVPEFGLPPRLFYVVDGMRQTVSPELIRKHDLDVGDEIIVRKKIRPAGPRI